MRDTDIVICDPSPSPSSSSSLNSAPEVRSRVGFPIDRRVARAPRVGPRRADANAHAGADANIDADTARVGVAITCVGRSRVDVCGTMRGVPCDEATRPIGYTYTYIVYCTTYCMCTHLHIHRCAASMFDSIPRACAPIDRIRVCVLSISGSTYCSTRTRVREYSSTRYSTYSTLYSTGLSKEDVARARFLYGMWFGSVHFISFHFISW